MALAGKFLEKSQSIGVLGVDPCPVGRRSASLKKKKKKASSSKSASWTLG